jgi:hypothetical protein
MTHPHMAFCASPSAVWENTKTNFPVYQSLYHLPHSTVSNAKLCYDFPNIHPSIFCDERINFLLVALHGGGSWWTTARQL